MIMNGRKTWANATTMPKELYISGSDNLISPASRSARLMTPLLPSRMVQP